jgi:superfamily II DNA or RNA helicase
VSGTPLRYDMLADMKLLATTGDVIYDLSNAYLIEQGYSAKPTVYIKTIESRKRTDWDTEYQDAYNQLVVESDKRNAFIASYAKLNFGSTLILVNRLDHGKRLQEMIAGSIFVHGNDTTEYRQSVIADMRSKAGIYIASPIFDEGIDVPGVDTVILAAGGKSHIKLLQRIGRGMRRKEGTNTLKILDFIDDTNKFLLDHSNERIDTYVKEGFDTVLID